MSERGGARDGFTLVEALAAFAIVAALTLVVQRGLVQSRHGLAAIEDRGLAEEVAHALLAEPLTAADVAAGGRSGAIAGRRFRVSLGPFDALPGMVDDADPPPGDGEATGPRHRAAWRLLRQRIEVETTGRGPVAVETVRLGPIPNGMPSAGLSAGR